MARAFDTVHGQALGLAAEQAALQAGVSSMFVNLSRRSQALVERQLQLIEQLESNEEDPDQLANLFQLDHLATRMRRNSENLLVLAGTDLAAACARCRWSTCCAPRCPRSSSTSGSSCRHRRRRRSSGCAASDVVHLLAELLDNATTFSPPDTQVPCPAPAPRTARSSWRSPTAASA